MNATNKDVFASVSRDIVRSVVNGYNGAIFCYGQTAAGKTYTMQGDKADAGIFGRSINEIFHSIEEATNRAFLIRVSYLEVYDEKIRDLLGEADDKKELVIRTNPKTNVSYLLQCLENIK